MLKIERSSKTLRELTLDKVREAILNAYFQPGQRLIERVLCEELGVSRTIVREVLRHLETEGLVESIPQKGPVVAILDPHKAAQIYEIRGLLEGHAARACAERCDDETIEKLASVIDMIEAAFENKDFQRVLDKTTQFYEVMFIGGGKTIAWEIAQSLNARINRLRAMTISSKDRGLAAVAEMRSILAAIKRRDPDAAYAESFVHLQRVSEIASGKLSVSPPAPGR